MADEQVDQPGTPHRDRWERWDRRNPACRAVADDGTRCRRNGRHAQHEGRDAAGAVRRWAEGQPAAGE